MAINSFLHEKTTVKTMNNLAFECIIYDKQKTDDEGNDDGDEKDFKHLFSDNGVPCCML